ncbi:hypothetical protein MASR2M36_22020 [Providencia sp.]
MKLSTYIYHALAASDNNFLLAHQQQSDELSEVTIHTQTWQFNDGVILKCIEEIEMQESECDSQCPERWIIWQVVEPCKVNISPKRKEFFNICQQQFWLKMQAAEL